MSNPDRFNVTDLPPTPQIHPVLTAELSATRELLTDVADANMHAAVNAAHLVDRHWTHWTVSMPALATSLWACDAQTIGQATPDVLLTALAAVDRQIPRQDHGHDSPHTGKIAWDCTVGREAGRVLWIELATWFLPTGLPTDFWERLPAKLTEIATAAGCSEYGIEVQTPEMFSYRMQWES